jgi:hypothetical protein
MKRLLFALTVVLGLGVSSANPASSATYTFTNLTIPGSTETSGNYAFHLNDLGDVVVHTDTGLNDVYNLHTKTYTPIPNDPAATLTVAGGVNNAGKIVGYYFTSAGGILGFSLSGGVFTTVQYPPGSTDTLLFDVSNNGQLAGLFYPGASGVQTGFVYSEGVFTAASVPAAWGYSTGLNGLNNAGTVVGYYLPNGAPIVGFYDQGVTYSISTGRSPRSRGPRATRRLIFTESMTPASCSAPRGTTS